MDEKVLDSSGAITRRLGRAGRTNDGHSALGRAGGVEVLERERQYSAVLARIGRWAELREARTLGEI